MAVKKIRKVKEVNGWKINHPHSMANIFHMIFALLLIAAPLGILFIFAVKSPLEVDATGKALSYSGFNGLDLVKFGLTYLLWLLGLAEDQPATHPLMNEIIYNSGSLLTGVAPYLIVATSVLVWLMIIFSVVLLIVWIVYLIKGYLKHSKVFKVFAALDFVCVILYDVIYLTFYIVHLLNNRGDTDAVKLLVWDNFYVLGGFLVLLIIISAIYTINFKDTILEKNLEYHEDTPTIEHVTKVHEVTKVKYEGSNTLPPNLTSIGGHAFAENQNLVVANIPLNITKLGGGAFANCLKLKVVSIPTSVIEIGYNCFFNCVELERINYSGTKEEWKKIARGSNWLAKAKTSEVVCIDGTIIVNPYH